MRHGKLWRGLLGLGRVLGVRLEREKEDVIGEEGMVEEGVGVGVEGTWKSV